MPQAREKIGPYILVKELGSGSFGVVWLAERHGKLATTRVALKLPLAAIPDPDALRHEAQIWVRVSGHPNVLPLTEANEYDGQMVFASEYAEEGSLEEWLKHQDGKKAPTVEQAVRIVTEILKGVAHLHRHRVLHQDLKPANVLLQGGTPRLSDFGVARVLDATQLRGAGTRQYMSPEALAGQGDERSDIWSVGVILYRLLSGRLPFPQRDSATLRQAIAKFEPDALPAGVPPAVGAVVLRALAKDPGKRYQTADQMREALQSAATKRGPRFTLPRLSLPRGRTTPSPRTKEVKTAGKPRSVAPSASTRRWKSGLETLLYALLTCMPLFLLWLAGRPPTAGSTPGDTSDPATRWLLTWVDRYWSYIPHLALIAGIYALLQPSRLAERLKTFPAVVRATVGATITLTWGALCLGVLLAGMGGAARGAPTTGLTCLFTCLLGAGLTGSRKRDEAAVLAGGLAAGVAWGLASTNLPGTAASAFFTGLLAATFPLAGWLSLTTWRARLPEEPHWVAGGIGGLVTSLIFMLTANWSEWASALITLPCASVSAGLAIGWLYWITFSAISEIQKGHPYGCRLVATLTIAAIVAGAAAGSPMLEVGRPLVRTVSGALQWHVTPAPLTDVPQALLQGLCVGVLSSLGSALAAALTGAGAYAIVWAAGKLVAGLLGWLVGFVMRSEELGSDVADLVNTGAGWLGLLCAVLIATAAGFSASALCSLGLQSGGAATFATLAGQDDRQTVARVILGCLALGGVGLGGFRTQAVLRGVKKGSGVRPVQAGVALGILLGWVYLVGGALHPAPAIEARRAKTKAVVRSLPKPKPAGAPRSPDSASNPGMPLVRPRRLRLSVADRALRGQFERFVRQKEARVVAGLSPSDQSAGQSWLALRLQMRNRVAAVGQPFCFTGRDPEYEAARARLSRLFEANPAFAQEMGQRSEREGLFEVNLDFLELHASPRTRRFCQQFREIKERLSARSDQIGASAAIMGRDATFNELQQQHNAFLSVHRGEAAEMSRMLERLVRITNVRRT